MKRLTFSPQLRCNPVFCSIPLRSLLLGCASLCCVSLLSGCGEAPVTGAATSDGADMVAPQQTQQALQQLRSPRAPEQLSGLLFLERFPSLAQSQVEQLSVLANSGASAAVKKKAAELLARSTAEVTPAGQ